MNTELTPEEKIAMYEIVAKLFPMANDGDSDSFKKGQGALAMFNLLWPMVGEAFDDGQDNMTDESAFSTKEHYLSALLNKLKDGK